MCIKNDSFNNEFYFLLYFYVIFYTGTHIWRFWCL